ncbi:MAG: TolC family protein [Sulfuritalea sp.]|jgi:outer membrane protein TolC|nr:TolC family protein [Sulfuritalea sp.]MDP1981097.1 TolC family protein [Sulfuritalea sp.]
MDLNKLSLLSPPRYRPIAIGLCTLILAGCALTPVPLSSGDVRTRVNTDQLRVYSNQEPLLKPIGFNEALARALKYNLDYRLKLMESALATGLADVARFDMLPNLVASAGYGRRSNESGGTSVGIETGLVSLIPSTSAERTHGTTGIELSWNILDFGVSYFRAQAQADQVLIAEERRRRVVQNILQDVRSAYWRAVGAQRLSREAARLMERVQEALQRSREAETQGLVAPKEALTYQRLLLDSVSLLTARKQELEFAKRELAALMNVTPGTEFSVIETEERELMPVPINVAELEELALLNRPELREEDYRARISASEAKRQLMSLLPGLNLSIATQTDTNRFLYNKSWIDSSARVTLNMLRLLALPSLENTHEAQKQTDEARRLALTMAILTQVRVAMERYRLAQTDLDVARESNNVDQRLSSYARAAMSTRTESELEVIRAETRALNSEYQRYAAYATAVAAYGRIYNSLGLDVVPNGLEEASIAELGDRVAANIASVENDTFVHVRVAAPSLPPFALRFDGVVAAELPVPRQMGELKIEERIVDDRGDRTQVKALTERLDRAGPDSVLKVVEQALKRNRLDVAQGDRITTLSLKLLIQEPRNGVRRAQWLITMLAPDGAILGQTRYTSTLAADPTPRSIAAFAEAATISNLRNIGAWLQTPGRH